MLKFVFNFGKFVFDIGGIISIIFVSKMGKFTIFFFRCCFHKICLFFFHFKTGDEMKNFKNNFSSKTGARKMFRFVSFF